ncbi:MAG: ThuA domain-containing protein, partial [Pirellula sp.]
MKNKLMLLGLLFLGWMPMLQAADTLVFEPANKSNSAKHVVLVAGDEEYRTEESMPMLGKILSQKHNFKCTVVFSLGPDGADYIDANNQQGLRGLSALSSADLMIIGTRFRQPVAEEAKHIASYLNAGKPVIGIRTATHAFRGNGTFDALKFDDFGLKILGETWVSHHGKHKVQGARGVAVADKQSHPILKGVKDVFCPSDVYGVIHLADSDEILLRAAVTESMDPSSANVVGKLNEPMQPFAWIREYKTPNGNGKGKAFCTTGGASVDFLSEGLRRMVVNAALHLTGQSVPENADVSFVDPFYPSFFGFINDKTYWKTQNKKPEDFGLGKTPSMPDPQGTPVWNFRPKPVSTTSVVAPMEFRQGERIAFMGSSLAERMNLFGYFETLLHTRFPNKQLVVRNFGWPADEVGNQQRPDNYTKIDDPLEVFGPETFICFFGFNEHFAGDSP